MISVSGILTVAKYGFIGIVLTGAGLLIANTAVIRHKWKNELVYKPSSLLSFKNSSSLLDKYFAKCLTQPSKSFCLLSADKRLAVFKSKAPAATQSSEEIKEHLRNVTRQKRNSHKHPVSMLMSKFNKLMKSLAVTAFLIEPSMLFCTLSSSWKFYLLSNGFYPGTLDGSQSVVTFGVFENDAKILDQSQSVNTILSSGFQMSRSRKWNRLRSNENSEYSFSTVHYLFTKRDLIVHVVVLYARGGYLWHSALSGDDVEVEGLLFVNDGAYENFTVMPLNLGAKSLNGISIPADPALFLLQIEASKFIECQNVKRDYNEYVTHPDLTKEQMRTRAIIVIEELKMAFLPEAITFWLWSKTLLGWYQECNIFSYTTELNFAVKAESVRKLNFSNIFANNEYLTMEERSSGEIDAESGFTLDCHDLRVNIFLAHEDGSEIWFKDTSKPDAEKYKLIYKKFQLCSTDIFNQKVHLPCEAEDIFIADYGENWSNIPLHGNRDIPTKNRYRLKRNSTT